MVIKRILNNNTIMSLDASGEEIVVKGKGIAFQKKIGDEVAPEKVERIFSLETKEQQRRYSALIKQIPTDCIDVCEAIIQTIKADIDKEISDNIYITLTDHICNLLERIQMGIAFDNGLLWDIKRLYPEEYKAGQKAVSIMRKAFDVAIDEDEASFVALHIVSAELNDDLDQVVKVTRMIEDVYDIVASEFDLDTDMESLEYTRFIIHLRIFFKRFFSDTLSRKTDDKGFIEILKKEYPKQYACTIKIFEYISRQYQKNYEGEILYILVHIIKLTT